MKNIVGALVLTLAFVCNTSATDKLPDNFPQCKRSDPNINVCLGPAIQNAIKFMKNGIPSLQLLPIDPLTIKRVVLEQGVGRPVNFKFVMTDTTAVGTSDSTMTYAKVDLKKREIEFEVLTPVFSLEGTYELDGKFSLLPLKGKGKFKMALFSYMTNMKLSADSKTKNGDVYWDVKNIDIVIKNPKNFTVHFDNLFNGNKVLGDSTNKALNDNWEGFWEELRPSMQETFGKLFTQISNVIFSKIPEKNIFLD